MTDRSALDIDEIMSPTIHEPSGINAPGGLMDKLDALSQKIGAAISDADYKPLPLDEEAERAAFEADVILTLEFPKTKGMLTRATEKWNPPTCKVGDYLNSDVQNRWLGWLASAKHSRPESALTALREIYEVYAGSEGFIAETAAEGYLQQLVKQMATIAGAELTKHGRG